MAWTSQHHLGLTSLLAHMACRHRLGKRMDKCGQVQSLAGGGEAGVSRVVYVGETPARSQIGGAACWTVFAAKTQPVIIIQYD
jgi:hypothetical protein